MSAMEKNIHKSTLKQKLRRYQARVALMMFILLFLIIYLAPSIFITVKSGEAGVLFKRFIGGTVTDKVFSEGLHIVAPWNTMTVYNVRLQNHRLDISALSNNGLIIKTGIAVRYHPAHNQLAILHQRVGPDYLDKIIVPVVISSVRAVIGRYQPEEIWTTQTQKVQDEVLVETVEQNDTIPIIYDDIIIEYIKLPDALNQAIEAKLMQQQQYLEYEFRLLKTNQEAKRKRVEAEGIKTYQSIISESLSDNLLKWQGIQATLDLANSPNTKVIIVGGKDGLPLILNTDGGGGQTPGDKSAPKPASGNPPTVQATVTPIAK
ncbi:MAG: prohibitin family protein [Deltaproteobacteria bacterium]|nr:prohibitin family protein [Deltaproteobacteria bacterium]